MNAIDPNVQKLGDDNSVWFKLSTLARGESENPMPVLMKLAERYGPAVGVDAIGLLYDTQAIPETPTSWNILWDPQYAGKINVMAPPSLIGISLTAITASMLGEDYTQSIDQATAKLQELAPNVQSFAPNPDEYQSSSGRLHMSTGFRF